MWVFCSLAAVICHIQFSLFAVSSDFQTAYKTSTYENPQVNHCRPNRLLLLMCEIKDKEGGVGAPNRR